MENRAIRFDKVNQSKDGYQFTIRDVNRIGIIQVVDIFNAATPPKVNNTLQNI